jgi:hypothetical protein
MGGFNPAWFIAAAIGILLVAADFMIIPEARRKTIGRGCLALGSILLLVGLAGLVRNGYEKFGTHSTSKVEKAQSGQSPNPPPAVANPPVETEPKPKATGSTSRPKKTKAKSPEQASGTQNAPNGAAIGTVTVQPGSVIGSIGQQGGLAIGQQLINPIINPPVRPMINCVPVMSGPLDRQIAYVGGKEIDGSSKPPGVIFVVVKMSDTTRYQGGASQTMRDGLEALAKIPDVSLLDDFTQNCGYALRNKAELSSISSLGATSGVTYFKENLRDRAEDILKAVGSDLGLKRTLYINPLRRGDEGVQALRTADFVRLSAIDMEIIF